LPFEGPEVAAAEGRIVVLVEGAGGEGAVVAQGVLRAHAGGEAAPVLEGVRGRVVHRPRQAPAVGGLLQKRARSPALDVPAVLEQRSAPARAVVGADLRDE